MTDDSKPYEETVPELIRAFLAIRDKSILLREFYYGKQNLFQKASKFFLNELELKSKLGFYLRFDELSDIILPLFHV